MLERKTIEYCDDEQGLHVTHIKVDQNDKTAEFYILPYSDTQHEIKYLQNNEWRKRLSHYAYFYNHHSDAYGIIFYQDVKELFISKPNYLTCGDYVHQKLEMYNFYSVQEATKENNSPASPFSI